MILRELAALFQIRFDGQGLQQADKAINQSKIGLNDLGGRIATLKTGLQGLVAGLAGTAAFGFLNEAVHAASDAEEAMNVLRQSFGDATDGMVAWADQTGEAVGRSASQMREMAAGLGALLVPMVGNRKAAAEMSQQLSTLAVDLGSFFNVADDDVLTALRAGISGESEPLKRFGIVMSEAALQEYALAQGITKRVKAMSNAEKTQLRHRFILDKTKDAQGDAARTADSYANSSKRLDGELENLKETIGLKFIDIFTTVVRWVGKGAKWFSGLAKHTHIVEAAVTLLSGVIAAKLIPMFPMLARAALPLLKPLLIFGLLFLLVEDLFTLFNGGDSVIGRFIDSLFGVGTSKQVVEDIKAAWDGFLLWFSEEGMYIPRALLLMFQDLGKWIGETAAKAYIFWEETIGKVKKLVEEVRSAIANAIPKGKFGDVVRGLAAKVGLDLSTGAVGPQPTVRAGNSSSSVNNTNVRGGNVTVNVQGGADKRTAQTIAAEVKRVIDREAYGMDAATQVGL